MINGNRFWLIAALATTSLVMGCDTGTRHGPESVDSSSTSGGITTGPTGPGNGTVQLTRVAPNTGGTTGGTAIVLNGLGFSINNGVAVYFFAPGSEVPGPTNAATNVQVVSDTQITCETPAHVTGVVDVRVDLGGGRFGILNNAFTFDPLAVGGALARVADFGNPTAWELEMLELANRARRDPVAEGNRLGLALTAGNGYVAKPPLSHNGFLAQAAGTHTSNMIAQNFYGHWDLAGVGPNGRILGTQFDLNAIYGVNPADNRTENIGVGSGNQFDTPQKVHNSFVVDAGTVPPKHRDNLLGKGTPMNDAREIGMGVRFGEATAAQRPTQTNVGVAGTPLAFSPNHWVTQEIARTKRDRAIISGVVYTDDGDGICEGFAPYRGNSGGEGRGGITVTLSHVSGFTIQTQTSANGFYAFETFVDTDFTITVEGAQATVTIGGANVKVDHVGGAIRTY